MRGGQIIRGAECAVHQTARPSLSPNDDITGARQATHTHSQTHTHLVSPRLRLLVYRAAQVTHSSPDGVCHRRVWCLHESGCVASVCAFVCSSTAECIGEMERDLPSDPLECASLMNSSVTQLIAKPATDLAVAS